ncbi:Bromodomain containing protein [Tritrichomonas foetus]|uniref:Bromodomain containing protein n=1 Tax=Tritrichomonas foetus TaxID=1144522 RepID=A0A1J4KNV1_9EUKA|nr:Bromodomain containing protein [Tritrichomonas foetus]|eukprot:OHT12969.1 Bromodomain containing protein [Tritrichomonas foetus]
MSLREMNPQNVNTIKRIMDQLLKMPTNYDFSYPLADRLQGYTDKISKPMDLGTIKTKVENGEYKNTKEWYDDVCLVYQNCQDYYPPKSLYPTMAVYNLKMFKKLAIGLECTSADSWYRLVRSTFDELIKSAGNSPVPQGLDPWLTNLPKHAEDSIPLTPLEIAETVNFLNRELAEKEEVRKDIYAILKEMQPDIKYNDDSTSIDAEKLSENTRRALALYARAHM